MPSTFAHVVARPTNPMVDFDRTGFEEWTFNAELRTLVEQSTAGVWIVDDQMRVRHANEGLARLGGYSVDEVVGQPVMDLVEPSYRARTLAALATVMRDGMPLTTEVPMRAKDGSLKWLLFSGTRGQTGNRYEILGFALDVTAQKRAAARDLRTQSLVELLKRTQGLLSDSTTEEQLILATCRDVVGPSESEHVVGWLSDSAGALRSVGCSNDSWTCSADALDLATAVLRTRTIQTASVDAPLVIRTDGSSAPLCVGVFVPLLRGGECFGVLGAFRHSDPFWPEDDLLYWSEVGEQVASVIGQLRHAAVRREDDRRIKRSLEATVVVVAAAIEARDPFTAGHQVNVARIASALAEALGLSPHRTEGLRLAALIHDVGKIGVPLEILSKPGPLLPAEIALLQEHPGIGHRILTKVEFPWPIATMVLQHHERLDGSGYPDHLKGDDILFESQILGAADFIEAYCADRPYHQSRGIASALALLQSGRGSLFADEIVDACERLFAGGGFAIEFPVESGQ